jgi:hypothetical protein
VREGDARGAGTIGGFTPEDIERGYRTQPYRGPHMFASAGNYDGAREHIPVPIEVTTLYELRQLRATIDRLGRRLFTEWNQ